TGGMATGGSSVGGVQVIAASGDSTCAVVDGEAWCWGDTPVRVAGLSSGVQAIAVSSASNVCAVIGGEVRCTTGGDPMKVVGLPPDTLTVAVAWTHSCAVAGGGVWCWGENLRGQLGSGSTTDSQLPVLAKDLSSGAQAVAVSGERFTCAVVNGGARCWGANGSGQLGNGSTTSSLAPVQVQGLASGVQAIATGLGHACAVKDGGVWCWGTNYDGELGNGSTTDSPVPVQVKGLVSGAQSIAAGMNYSCAVVGGGAWCWGSNYFGKLGNNSKVASSVPVQVQGLDSGVQAIACGGYPNETPSSGHTCALTNGSIRCWGSNYKGQLADGTHTAALVPNPPIQFP
ncbi:MAG TPA: RCC1 repeat-containing protein, partial [Polyangia bacterium]|nr:RCC1 repeat-containing protein [Polyangia bacterium]